MSFDLKKLTSDNKKAHCERAKPTLAIESRNALIVGNSTDVVLKGIDTEPANSLVDSQLSQEQSVHPLRMYRGAQLYGPNGLLGISRSKFYQLVRTGKIGPPLKLGSISLWPEATILAAINGWKNDTS